tara:strand:- start:620 stop:844 length:225 start_codon:yes stop_codon:yes gene_type:complete
MSNNEKNLCTICNTPTLISHYIKYFIDDCGKIILGGSEPRGPLCQNCWFNIGDKIYGKPRVLKKEHGCGDIDNE